MSLLKHALDLGVNDNILESLGLLLHNLRLRLLEAGLPDRLVGVLHGRWLPNLMEISASLVRTLMAVGVLLATARAWLSLVHASARLVDDVLKSVVHPILGELLSALRLVAINPMLLERNTLFLLLPAVLNVLVEVRDLMLLQSSVS